MQVTGSAVGTHAVSIRVGEHPIFEQTFRILHGSAVAGIRLHGPYTWGGLFRDNGLVLAELHEADGTPIFGDHGMMWSIGGSRESGRGEVYRYTKKKSGAVTSTLQVSDGTHSAQTEITLSRGWVMDANDPSCAATRAAGSWPVLLGMLLALRRRARRSPGG